MNTTLIIYCHPYKRSFNHAVLEAVISTLASKGRSWKLIDLHQAQFNPTYDVEELRLFHQGKSHDQQTIEYLDDLRRANTVIFITPVWWNSIPGMLKGFVDKVMKEGAGLSHTVTKFGVHGELGNIKHGYVLTTSTSPTFYLRFFSGNGIQKIFIHQTLRQLGISHCKWINFGNISNSTLSSRKKYLQQLRSYNFS
ncbi:NAD(P)H-dependent oxidoreductase [Lentilactobacillus buchneri]|uniref:Putative NADPH-quinone reductase n=1 Tax=Lentilactobacillus buchneri subsp. silagei CD034 TaxID=1071400 RepID=J9W4F1_LENBU|nr:NAD(P)H-dependent oxidoreductase [Lentilactobacillus buchneri]MCC6100026.1 NAD(P)H-dependent oxidoreductase [Lactobacillus sp.]AFS00512.1 putative NADPH-quinone reductase [Lentilactobacillus buchneri subsp. silagei CD034]MCT2900109.1 flavodoxin family protein [Lentilactobacillus buchneri]MCT3542193.1 flavodoxin family protein [Lentilactobacillus buchneri]MCT3544652.1 flavodoxin family protein [Lentilactobacillus buchneri]